MASSALEQFHSSLAAGDLYGAHQKVRTTAARLLAPPRRGPAPSPDENGFLPFDAKAQEAAVLLHAASVALLEKGETGSGADLAGLLVDLWKARGVQCQTEQRAKIIQLIALTGSSGSWRKTLTDAAFSWSAKTGSGPAGDVGIHEYFGTTLYKEHNYHLATIHLLSCPTSDAARTLADVLFDWSKLDPEAEKGVGRYAARGVLSYLESTSILAARVFLSHFLSHVLTTYPSLRVVNFLFPAAGSPLAASTTLSDELVVTKLASLNFLQLAVRTCQVGAGEQVEKGEKGEVVKGGGRKAWADLCKRYEREIKWLKSPEAKESTAELGTLYFGIKPPRGAGNPFADMLSGMFGGGGGGGGGLGVVSSVSLNTGSTIPQVGFGTWQSAPGEVAKAVEVALKAGYTHLDLAKIYQNQNEVAEGIKAAGVDRSKLFITSKLWNNSHKPEHVAAALDDTLKELELEYLDLYLIHWPVAFADEGDLAKNLFPKEAEQKNGADQVKLDLQTTLVDTWKAMIKLLDTKKVKAIGVSNFSVKAIDVLIKETGVTPAAHQIERHPLLIQPEVVKHHKEKNIHITAYSPLGNNNVGEKKLFEYPEVIAIADKIGATPAQVLIAWGQVGGHSIIPKSVTPSRIESNFKQITLSDEHFEEISKLGEKRHRFNIPFDYRPQWDINVFGEDAESSASNNLNIV